MGKPVVIDVPTMSARGEQHAPGAGPRAVPAVWPPAGYVAVLLPAEKAYDLVAKGEAIACQAVFENEAEKE